MSFTAVEHGRTVNSWENASLAGYSAKIGRAATVDSLACFEDILAIKLLLNFIKGASDVVTLDVFSAKLCFECDRSFLGDDFDRELAFGVAVKVESFFYSLCRVLFTEIDDFLRGDNKGEVFLLFTSNFRELELSCDNWLNGFLAVF